MMTNELKDYSPGSYIETFISAGPKNYSYRVFSPNEQQYHYVTKVRGFSLSSAASKHINFQSLRRQVHAFVKDEGRVIENNIVSSRIERTAERQVVTKTCNKTHCVVYDKRVVNVDFTTLPFGY